MSRGTRTLAVGLALMLCLVGGGVATASEEDNEKRCHRYAETGVRQQMSNLRGQCGNEGGGWHTDYADHYTWCLTAPPEEPASEIAKRDERLDDCEPVAVEDQRCHDYARAGVKQAQDNFRFGCGHRGPPWHFNYLAHLDWCQTVDVERSAEESAMRDDLLASCR